MSEAGRARPPVPDFRFGLFVLQPAARRLLRDGVPVTCPKLVFDVLHYLIEHRDRAVGRDELAAAVWQRTDVADVQIGQVVLRARRAVDDDGTSQHSIATVPGFGYHWVAPTLAVPRVALDGADAPMHLAERYASAEPPEPRPGADVRGREGSAAEDSASPDATVPVNAATDNEPASAPPSAPAIDAPVAADSKRNNPPRRPLLVAALASIAFAALLVVSLRPRTPDTAAPTPPADNVTPATPSAPTAPATAPAHAILLPLHVDGRPEHTWLRLGGMDLVADRLRAAGLRVPNTESVLAALRTAGDDAQAQHAALRTAFGTDTLVEGDARLGDDGVWQLRLVARDGSGQPPRAGAAQQADAVTAAIVAADALAAALGGTPPQPDAGSPDTDADWHRARAALLANETDVARRILTASRQLDARPAERTVRLAQVDLREGRFADADAALTTLLAQLPPGRDDTWRAQAFITRGATRSRLGDFDASWRDFDAALQAMPADTPPLERARALSGRGTNAIPTRRLDTALDDMGQARSLFDAAGDTFGTARVDANLGMLELYRARPAAALDHLDAAAERLHAFGAQHEWQIVLTAQVQAHLALLDPEAAAAVADTGWAQRDRSRDPEQRSDIALNRAQVFLATGRYRDAATLLADPQLDTVQGAVLRTRLTALRAELAAREARWQDAATLADAALAAWPASGAEREREPLLLLAVHAHLALGDIAAAAALADRPTSPFALPDDLAWHELARAAWLRASGDTVAADAALQSALDAAGQGGVPATLAAVAEAMVPVQLAAGQLDQARAVAGRVAPWADRDFASALVQVRVLHAAGTVPAWRTALARAQTLAGERPIPESLTQSP